MPPEKLFENELTNKIAVFLTQIGIATIAVKLPEETFLPGIEVKNGALLVDEEKLEFPGDLLHEAGHLALAPADLRPHLSGEVVLPDEHPDILEMEAMLWSYAACLHLRIEPRIVFHGGGYRGKSERLLFNFRFGIFTGIKGLEEKEMALGGRKAREIGVEPFPKMQKWLRD